MSNPMTGNTLEQRARELLAKWRERAEKAGDDFNSGMSSREAVMLRDLSDELEAALRLSAGADWVLVPREPTPEMLDAGWAEGAKLCESGAPDFAAAWTAMLAAAPRHESSRSVHNVNDSNEG